MLEGLAMKDVGIFYGRLVHFTAFCYILETFGIVRGYLAYFSRFVTLYQEKSGNPVPVPLPARHFYQGSVYAPKLGSASHKGFSCSKSDLEVVIGT
jgi:hypothetical protein